MKLRGILALVFSLSMALVASNALANSTSKNDKASKNDKQSSQQAAKAKSVKVATIKAKSVKVASIKAKSSKPKSIKAASVKSPKANSVKGSKGPKSEKPGNGYGHCKSDKSGQGHSKKIGNGHDRDDNCGPPPPPPPPKDPICENPSVVRYDIEEAGKIVSIEWRGKICDPILPAQYLATITPATGLTCSAVIPPPLVRVVSADGKTFSYPVKVVLNCVQAPPPPPVPVCLNPAVVRYDTRTPIPNDEDARSYLDYIEYKGFLCDANPATVAPYLQKLVFENEVVYPFPSIQGRTCLATNPDLVLSRVLSEDGTKFSYPVNIRLQCQQGYTQ